VRVETIEVLVPINAYDESGLNVTNLELKDLLIVENGEPRTITNLRREPASIVLILDLGNGIGTFKNGASATYNPVPESSRWDPTVPVWAKRHDIVARPASREFADNFVRGLSSDDRVAIIQYSDRVELIQDFTSDREQALVALSSKYRIGLKSRFYDALSLAAEKIRHQPGRRVIVLLSDGLDTASKTTRQKALEAVAHSSATVLVVGWDEVLRNEINAAIGWKSAHDEPGTDLAKRLRELKRFLSEVEGARYDLEDLAEANGGELVAPRDFPRLVNDVPLGLLREIGAQYSLAFLTERGTAGEADREINVISARKGMSVRSRRSYHLEDQQQ
jgi:VWFA-related protein